MSEFEITTMDNYRTVSMTEDEAIELFGQTDWDKFRVNTNPKIIVVEWVH